MNEHGGTRAQPTLNVAETLQQEGPPPESLSLFLRLDPSPVPPACKICIVLKLGNLDIVTQDNNRVPGSMMSVFGVRVDPSNGDAG